MTLESMTSSSGSAMTHPSPNFAFLEPHDASLFETATLAEQHFHGDPAATLVRLRMFAELLCQRLGDRHSLRNLNSLELCARMEKLEKRGFLQRPQLDAAHRIRKSGNEAAHGRPVDQQRALARLRDAHTLSLWYVRAVLGRQDVIPGRFQPPPPPAPAAHPEPAGPPDRFAPVRAEQRQLQAALIELADIAAKGGEEELGERCARAAGQLGGQEFTVAVLGEFKAGKTTLVNALCGREVLPTATLECTAAVTVIHGSTPERADMAVLTRTSGDKAVVPLDDLEDSLTVRSARDAADPTELADVWLSNVPLLRHGVALVDTPGLNAAGLARERATLHYLPKADAVVFVTRADRLLTETEVTFIRERLLEQNLARLFVVVNHADAIDSDEERADVTRRARELLDPLAGTLRLHLVCAEDAIEALEDDDPELFAESGVPAFQQAMETFLVEQRAQAELARARKQVQAFRSELGQRLRERREIASMDGQLAERRRERIRAWMAYARDDEQALLGTLRTKLQALRRGPMQQVCEGSRVRLEQKLKALKLDGERVDESHARSLVDSVGGQSLTQLQASISTGLPPIQREVSAKIQELFDKAELHPSPISSSRALAPMDFGTLVRVSSSQESREIQRAGAAPVQQASSGDFGVGAAVGGLIGAAIAGPFGAAVGAFIGAAMVGEVSQNQSASMRSLTEVFTRKRISAHQTATDFQKRLEQGASDAIGGIRAEMEEQIRGLVREKTRTLQRQLDDLDTGPGGDRAGLVRLEAAIGRLESLRLNGLAAEA
jgi:GTPase Era involved in 16S rRNA processing